MKLYSAGYGKWVGVVAADNEEEAIEKIKIKLNIHYLPVTAQELEIDGFTQEVEPIPCLECERLIEENETLRSEVMRLFSLVPMTEIPSTGLIEPEPIPEPKKEVKPIAKSNKVNSRKTKTSQTKTRR